MSVLSQVSAGLCCIALMSVPATAVSPSSTPLQLFSECAGRFEAEADFARAWAQEPRATFRERQSLFEDLITSVRTQETDHLANRLKLQAKSAHISLLWRAQFALVEREARIARQMANSNLAFCTALLTA